MSNSSQPKDSSETLTINSRILDDVLKDCTIDLSGTGVNMNDVTVVGAVGSPYTYDSLSSITLTPTTINASGTIATSTYTVGSITTSDTITIQSFDPNQYTFNFPEEWRNSFPEWSRVQDMCKKYPGLKIAFDNFKVFYEMVKDDYDNPTPKK